jgi:hypothetical protein
MGLYMVDRGGRWRWVEEGEVKVRVGVCCFDDWRRNVRVSVGSERFEEEKDDDGKDDETCIWMNG